MKRVIRSSTVRTLGMQLVLGGYISLFTAVVFAGWFDRTILFVFALGFIVLLGGAFGLASRRSRFAPGGFVAARVLVLVSFGYLFMSSDRLAFFLIVIEAGLIAVESVVNRINFYVATARQQFNPRYRKLAVSHARTEGLPTLTSLAALVAATVGLIVPSAAAVALAIAVGAHFAALLVAAVRLFTIRRLPSVPNADITPFDVMVHFSGSPSALYQLNMWLPVFSRMKLRTLVVVRDSSTLLELFPSVNADLVFVKRPQDLDKIVDAAWCPPVVCYVNSAPANAHLVRFRELTHVQLNHGDSEKGPSSSKVMRMFDVNFVAGTAAVGRFEEAGISVANDFFRIVGRPQLDGIVRVSKPSAVTTVLYAPTWRGSHSDVNYSSLAAAPTITQTLINAGFTVIFRPHPFSRDDAKDSTVIATVESMLSSANSDATPHVFGEPSQRAMSITEAFNRADALVTDVSSVSSDFLFTGKPQAVIVNSEASDEESIERLSLGAHIIALNDSLGPDLSHALDDMRTSDSKRSGREKVAHDVLGPVSDPDYFSLFERELTALVRKQNRARKGSGE